MDLYTTDQNISPEMIFDLGEPLKRVRSANELPQKGVFALMVFTPIPKEVESKFKMKLIAQFDINNLKEGKSGHKSRKTSKLYQVEKK